MVDHVMPDGFSIRRALVCDIPQIRSMADVVFRRTYSEILSDEQLDFMMEWMYSEDSLCVQICGEMKEFYIVEADGMPVGYVSFEFEDVMEDGRKRYHLQKLYVLPEFQRRGLGESMVRFVMGKLAGLNPQGCRMELNVNRRNEAVGFYEKMGLRRDREGDFPIGRGFYMNDYIYCADIQGR